MFECISDFRYTDAHSKQKIFISKGSIWDIYDSNCHFDYISGRVTITDISKTRKVTISCIDLRLHFKSMLNTEY